VAINFTIFGVPYVMHVGIASLCTVLCTIGSVAHVQYRAIWKNVLVSWKVLGKVLVFFSEQENWNPSHINHM